MNEKLIDYIENSFLKDLILNKNITDISFNGDAIYYQDNLKGRVKSEIIIDNNEAYNFIRQVSNLSEALFSYSNPILDINCGRYRISATHYSICRKHKEKVINFSIRISDYKLKISEDNSFISDECINIIKYFLTNKDSIMISGLTGSGKTELQRFILTKIQDNSRIIYLDNIDEVDIDEINNKLDIQTWVVNNQININFDVLVKNALRSNPDYLIIGEARGEEMLSLLNSAMSGHPTISTIHSKNIENTYSRMVRLSMLKNQNLKFNETLIDVMEHFKLLIHVKKRINEGGNIIRYVDSMGTNSNGEFIYIYRYPNFYNYSYLHQTRSLKGELCK